MIKDNDLDSNYISGLEVIGSPMLPPNTIYCSMDIFTEFKKSTKTNGGILERLIQLYEKQKE